MDFPAHLFDIVALTLLIYWLLTFIYNWVADIESFRRWYQEREVWSEFKTHMPIDKTFYGNGARLIMTLFTMKEQIDRMQFDELPSEIKSKNNDFAANLELYIRRLDYHQRDFSIVSWHAKIYIFVMWGAVPVIATLSALIILLLTGTFPLPHY